MPLTNSCEQMELFTVVGTRSTVSYTFPSSRVFNQVRDDVEVVLTTVGTRSTVSHLFFW